MPTQQTLYDSTRRLINEASPGYESQTVINNHLLTAYWVAQERITDIAPNEFLAAVTADIVAGQDRYARPTREIVRRYEYKPVGSTKYYELPTLVAEQAIPIVGEGLTYTDGSQLASPRYYIEGEELVLVPTPTVDIEDGLACVYVNAEVFGLSTAEPKMPKSLQHLLSYGAAIFALDESKDAAEDIVNGYRRKWEMVFGSTDEARATLRRHYRRSQSLPIIGRNLG